MPLKILPQNKKAAFLTSKQLAIVIIIVRDGGWIWLVAPLLLLWLVCCSAFCGAYILFCFRVFSLVVVMVIYSDKMQDIFSFKIVVAFPSFLLADVFFCKHLLLLVGSKSGQRAVHVPFHFQSIWQISLTIMARLICSALHFFTNHFATSPNRTSTVPNFQIAGPYKS